MDQDGQVVYNASTLDEFEQFWKIIVDFGLGLCTLVNSGVKLDGLGSMTTLVVISAIVGKYLGTMASYSLAKSLGFMPPLGVRTRHVSMIATIAPIGLTIALFMSDVAFVDPRVQRDAKVGALLTSLIGIIPCTIAQVYDFRNENVGEQAKLQLQEELEEARQRFNQDNWDTRMTSSPSTPVVPVEVIKSAKAKGGREMAAVPLEIEFGFLGTKI